MASRKGGSRKKAAAKSAAPGPKKGAPAKATLKAPALGVPLESVAAAAISPASSGAAALESLTSGLTSDQTKLIKQLADLTDELVKTKTEEAARDAAEAVREKLDEVERELGTGHDLGDFISQVGQGLAGAQRALDRESRKYSAGNPRHPTAYRVPRVQAELNLSLSSVRRSGISFVVVNRKDETRTQTQRVSFEIVAAPLPATFASVPLAELLVLDPEEREDVRRRAQAYVASGAADAVPLAAFLTPEALPGILIVRLARAYALVRLDDSTAPPKAEALRLAMAADDESVTGVAQATALALDDLRPWLESTRRTQEALLRAG